ncbi:MAG: cupin domain-containing protein [Gaiellales bacterium]
MNVSCDLNVGAASGDTETPGYRVLAAGDAFWRPSNQMRVQTTDLANQVGSTTLGLRLWRLTPGQASTRHRHFKEHELYVVLEGTGRMRIGDEVLTLEPLSAVGVDPPIVRQVFNDTDRDVLWLVAGSPKEFSNTLEMTPERLAALYPDGPQALPPELEQ